MDQLFELLDGEPSSVAECALAVTQAFWRIHSEGGCRISRSEFPPRCTVEESRLQKEVQQGLSQFRFENATAEQLVAAVLCALGPERRRGDLTVDSSVFSVRHVLGRIADRRRYAFPDLIYHAFRRIRVHHNLWLNGMTLRLVRNLAAAANELFDPRGSGQQRVVTPTAWEDHLSKVIGYPPGWDARMPDGASRNWPKAFFDILLGDGLAQPHPDGGWIVRHWPLGWEKIVSRVFGLPTAIEGFDALFDGGLLLLDSLPGPDSAGIRSYKPPAGVATIPARTVLVIGPFGSGKSSLTLQMAVEVARKGGVAWVIAFEQNIEECEYALESMGVPLRGQPYEVVHDIAEATAALLVPESGGVIIFYRPPREPAENSSGLLQSFLDRVQRRLPLLEQYPLRVMIIDPINSVLEAGARGAVDLRNRLFATLEAAKLAGINVWMTGEQTEERPIEGRFEENLADTVIRLSVERDASYPHRFIEVTKSRLQRERQGRHLFRITSHRGVHVVPMIGELVSPLTGPADSPASIDSKIPGLDNVLGEESIEHGDIIALEGPTGTSKTLLAAQFLIGRDLAQGHSLIVSDFGCDKMKDIVTRTLRGNPASVEKKESEFRYLPVRLGYADPQDILAALHTILREQAQEGHPIDRAAVGNISRWELGLPLLVERDPIFGSSLLELLRRYKVTTFMTCGYGSASRHSDTALKNLLLEQADCVLEFSTVRAGGRYRQTVRAVKTRRMDHRSGRFQIESVQGSLHIGNETLFRDGSEAAPVNLYLHSETSIHRRYNQQIVDALRAVISPKADVKRQTHRFETGLKRFAHSSAVDEVQVLQLDEFQLPLGNCTPGGDQLLHEFTLSKDSPILENLLPDLRGRVLRPGSRAQHCFAVPFYVNLSLLAYRKSAFVSFPGSWEELAKQCSRWERANGSPDKLFFGCQVAHANRFESYNCLFLEILSSLAPVWRRDRAKPITVPEWLETAGRSQRRRNSPLSRALRIFHTLAKRCHDLVFQHNLARPEMKEEEWESGQFEVNQRALVWRQWYSTLNELVVDFSADERKDIGVRLLYGTPSQPDDFLTTAGEWYLSVPSYSASPELALQIIEFLTSTDQEMQRLGQGIGLPTRVGFYEKPGKGGSWGAFSPYLDIDVSQMSRLVTSPDRMLRRSRFVNYAEHSGILSLHLLRLLGLPGPRLADEQIDSVIQGMLRALRLAASRGAHG